MMHLRFQDELERRCKNKDKLTTYYTYIASVVYLNSTDLSDFLGHFLIVDEDGNKAEDMMDEITGMLVTCYEVFEELEAQYEDIDKILEIFSDKRMDIIKQELKLEAD